MAGTAGLGAGVVSLAVAIVFLAVLSRPPDGGWGWGCGCGRGALAAATINADMATINADMATDPGTDSDTQHRAEEAVLETRKALARTIHQLLGEEQKEEDDGQDEDGLPGESSNSTRHALKSTIDQLLGEMQEEAKKSDGNGPESPPEGAGEESQATREALERRIDQLLAEIQDKAMKEVLAEGSQSPEPDTNELPNDAPPGTSTDTPAPAATSTMTSSHELSSNALPESPPPAPGGIGTSTSQPPESSSSDSQTTPAESSSEIATTAILLATLVETTPSTRPVFESLPTPLTTVASDESTPSEEAIPSDAEPPGRLGEGLEATRDPPGEDGDEGSRPGDGEGEASSEAAGIPGVPPHGGAAAVRVTLADGETTHELEVPEGVVENTVAAAAAMKAGRAMARNLNAAAAEYSACPTKQATPLRLPALPNTVLDSADTRCASDSRLLDLHLRNHTLWAVQMQDAGAGGITGLLEGNVYHLGDFDECLEATGPITPRYCVAEIRVHTPPRTPDHRQHPDSKPDPMQSVWNRIRHEGEDWRLPLDTLHVALCAPASCASDELESSVQRALDNHADCAKLPVSFSVRIPEALCTSTAKQHPPLSRGEILYIVVVVFFVLAVVYGTCIDWFATDKKSNVRWLFVMFSAKRNWHLLTKNDPKPAGLNLDPLSGARTLNMLLLVTAHRGFNILRGPVHNYNHFEAVPRTMLQTGATHANLFVDTCFALSGLLVTLLELTRAHNVGVKHCVQEERPGLVAAVVHRYLRLTPSYAMVVFFYATLFWRVGSGPLWDQVIGHESEACAKHWWANIFYVNNYVDTEKLCMFQSWYLPCDLHLFVIGTALTLVLARYRRTGLACIGVFFVLATAIPFVVTFLGRKPALLEMLPTLFRAPDKNDNFRTIYAPTHVRAAPYVVGMFAGYFFFQHGLRVKDQYSKGVTWLLCLGGGALAAGSMLSSVVFYDPDMTYNGYAAGLYAALCPVVWAVGVCLIFAGLVLGSKTCVSAFLSWRPLVILSRLTYNVYLTHWAFQVASVAKARTPYHLDVYNTLTLSFGDLVLSFGVSTLLFLLVEAPFRTMARNLTAPPPEDKTPRRSPLDEKPSALEAGAMRR